MRNKLLEDDSLIFDSTLGGRREFIIKDGWPRPAMTFKGLNSRESCGQRIRVKMGNPQLLECIKGLLVPRKYIREWIGEECVEGMSGRERVTVTLGPQEKG
jgi:hypothetical protein